MDLGFGIGGGEGKRKTWTQLVDIHPFILAADPDVLMEERVDRLENENARLRSSLAKYYLKL